MMHIKKRVTTCVMLLSHMLLGHQGAEISADYVRNLCLASGPTWLPVAIRTVSLLGEQLKAIALKTWKF